MSLRNLIVLVSVSALLLEAVAGPTRYALIGYSHLSYLYYFPRGVLIVILVIVLIGTTQRQSLGRDRIALWALVLLVLYSTTIGSLMLNSPVQSLVGVWFILPFLFGAMVMREFCRRPGLTAGTFGVLWFVVVIGILLGGVVEYPWTDETRSIFGHTVDAAKSADYLGVARNPGFSRAPYASALQALLSMIPLLCYIRNRPLRGVVYSVTLISVIIAFSKSAIVVTLVIGILMLAREPIRMWIGKAIVVASVMIGAVLPVLAAMIGSTQSAENGGRNFVVASFEERIQIAWPEAVRLITQEGAWLTGRGIGGMDAAQKLYEPEKLVPVDSFYLYLIGTHGVLGIALLWFFVWAVIEHKDYSPWGQMLLLISATLSLWGVTRIIFEEYFGMFFLGILIAGLVLKRPQSRMYVADRWKAAWA